MSDISDRIAETLRRFRSDAFRIETDIPNALSHAHPEIRRLIHDLALTPASPVASPLVRGDGDSEVEREAARLLEDIAGYAWVVPHGSGVRSPIFRRSDLDALIAAARRAGEDDRERLDWLEAHPEARFVVEEHEYKAEAEIVLVYDCQGIGRGSTIRDAIDDARSRPSAGTADTGPATQMEATPPYKWPHSPSAPRTLKAAVSTPDNQEKP